MMYIYKEKLWYGLKKVQGKLKLIHRYILYENGKINMTFYMY